MDMISDLPDLILHEIMSRLPHKDSARTTVLSKSWRQSWSTFPILVFNKFFMRERNNFCDFVDNSLLRFHNQCLSIKQFKLRMDLNDEINSSLYPRIDYWMELARECRVEVLDITILGVSAEWCHLMDEWFDVPSSEIEAITRYQVPSSVFEAKSLVKLSLYGRISLDQAFFNHPIKFSSLKVLCLTSVHFVDKQVFQNLLRSCPLIEYITLDMCYGIEHVYIHGISKLKGVKIVGFIADVEIDAPSLQNFYYIVMIRDMSCTAETKIKMDKCISLNELSLTCFNVTPQWFLQHYHLFTHLQILELRFCIVPRGINMSCSQLKVIKLVKCHEMNASIDAPKLNLCSYIYEGFCHELPIISSFLNCSRQLEISVRLTIYSALDYWKLRTFFLELPSRNVLATLSIFHIPGPVETDVLQDFSVPPPVIKHLHLHASFEKFICLPHAASLLWSCRPSIISCRLRNRTIIKVLCETLMSKKKEECFCSSKHIECWWHDLKDVKVTCSSGTCGNEISVDCKNFLDVLPTLNVAVGNVSFRLE